MGVDRKPHSMILGQLEESQAVNRSQSHGDMGGDRDDQNQILAERFKTIDEEDELKTFLTNNGEALRKLTDS